MLRIVCTFVALGDGGEDEEGEEQHPACGRSAAPSSTSTLLVPLLRFGDRDVEGNDYRECDYVMVGTSPSHHKNIHIWLEIC